MPPARRSKVLLISREARPLMRGQQTEEKRRKLHNPPRNRAGLRASPYRHSRESFFPSSSTPRLQFSATSLRPFPFDSRRAISHTSHPPPVSTKLCRSRIFLYNNPLPIARERRSDAPLRRDSSTHQLIISGGLHTHEHTHTHTPYTER